MGTIKKNIATIMFFLDEFHQGAVNHVIHFAGFTLLGYGLGIKSLPIILLSPIIMESGHIYNYVTGKHKHLAYKIIPIQILAWLAFIGLGYLLTKIFT